MVSGHASWEHQGITDSAPPSAPPPWPPPPPAPQPWRVPRAPGGLVRSRDDRVIAGVASGVARRVGIDPLICRIAFVVLTIAGGSGVLIYVVAWLWLPKEGSSENIIHRSTASRRDVGQTVAVAVLV